MRKVYSDKKWAAVSGVPSFQPTAPHQQTGDHAGRIGQEPQPGVLAQSEDLPQARQRL